MKNNYHTNKSYTCKLQQEIYKDNPSLYKEDDNNEESVYMYLSKMHPNIAYNYYPEVMPEINDIPKLSEIIASDYRLKNIYSSDTFILKVDDIEYKLESQIIKKVHDIVYLTDQSKIILYIKKGVLEDSEYPANNSLYMMLLSGNLIQYGDEKRIKQEHIMTHQIYTNRIIKNISDKDGYYQVDIAKILSLYYKELPTDKPNNLFFTTTDLRDYHYLKQKNNAYYHIQTINLPFQHIEFYYVDMEVQSD